MVPKVDPENRERGHPASVRSGWQRGYETSSVRFFCDLTAMRYPTAERRDRGQTHDTQSNGVRQVIDEFQRYRRWVKAKAREKSLIATPPKRYGVVAKKANKTKNVQKGTEATKKATA